MKGLKYKLPIALLLILILSQKDVLAALKANDRIVEYQEKSNTAVEKKHGEIDEMPRFPGCEEITNKVARKNCSMKKLIEFMFTNIKYPEEAKKHFEIAYKRHGDNNLLVAYMYGRFYAVAVQDRALFNKMMKQVLDADPSKHPDLRLTNEIARDRAIDRLQRTHNQLLDDDTKESKVRQTRIEWMIDEIRSLERGAFAPWTRRPVVQAILIPFGGVGIVAILEVLTVVGL